MERYPIGSTARPVRGLWTPQNSEAFDHEEPRPVVWHRWNRSISDQTQSNQGHSQLPNPSAHAEHIESVQTEDLKL